uniref:Dynein assembly factor 1, axonemal homolog n=1 Tax=Caenorhabditis japonica TaxID=281687 RepID=A0A8R1HLE8_CAEJA
MLQIERIVSNKGNGDIVKEIISLENLKNLIELNLPGNALRVIEGLDTLSNLKSLCLAQNGITKLDGLSGLSSLLSLDLNDNIVEKIENIGQVKGIHNLMIRKNKLDSWHDLYQLREIEQLEALTMEMNPIYSSDYTYRNRMTQILPSIKMLDGFPISWRQGDPYQPLSPEFYELFERIAID